MSIALLFGCFQKVQAQVNILLKYIKRIKTESTPFFNCSSLLIGHLTNNYSVIPQLYHKPITQEIYLRFFPLIRPFILENASCKKIKFPKPRAQIIERRIDGFYPFRSLFALFMRDDIVLSFQWNHE